MIADFSQYGLALSVLVFAVLALLEAMAPRKQRAMQRGHRWLTNITIIVVDSVAVRLMGPIVAIGAASFAAQQGIGLFHWINLPTWAAFILSLILLDLAIYVQHILTHKIPILWSFHKVHHADRDIDVTTGFRFHPVEIILSMLYKCVLILLLGPSIFAVFVFALILNLCAMFNHSNLRFPLGFDRILRLVLVTPDMHRVHHSIVPRETDSNYGSSISLWDRAFKTYIAQPSVGHDDMVIGIAQYQSEDPAGLLWSLKIPFMGSSNARADRSSGENLKR